jgi:hypothetical protein
MEETLGYIIPGTVFRCATPESVIAKDVKVRCGTTFQLMERILKKDPDCLRTSNQKFGDSLEKVVMKSI